MDLLSTLRRKISELPADAPLPGLRAVELHVEVGFRHLERGQRDLDETAYTDAVYRSNQAFEGAIKEAYKVLIAKPVDKTSPFEIENYFSNNSVFKPRVLAQFSNYRKEWRNPSAHDHTLVFDENEALIALASVTTFACVLTDQIAEHLAKVDSARLLRESPNLVLDLRKTSDDQSLSGLMLRAVSSYANLRRHISAPQNESQIIGSLTAYVAAFAPDVHIELDMRSPNPNKYRADIVARRDQEAVLVQVKRLKPRQGGFGLSGTVDNIAHAAKSFGAQHGIVFISVEGAKSYDVTPSHLWPHVSLVKPQERC
ncbi:hypothetical protein [Herbaspirillum sp. B65]|uniref:hypothetical protein n=1 Tax=Herbaspirillum sp. B65 TaxID=137708 RepID=UPI0011D2ACCB|nr:hypothetical protein [Herbaspirillum sp. B65]